MTQVELLFSQMTDLVTGKSILIDPRNMIILCVPQKLPELKIALHAARTRSGQFPQSGSPTNAQPEIEGSPLVNDVDYPLVASKILWKLLTDPPPNGAGIDPTKAKEYVFAGHFPKALIYRQVLPFETFQAPPGNPEEFNQDIIVQVKVREWGVAGVQSPQHVAWSLNN
jgi:hypothetical protein